MEQLNINKLLNRKNQEKILMEYLNYFEDNKKLLSINRGVYIYGSPGTGKTYFVNEILKKMDYDIIKYDAGDVRNKSIIETITKHNMSDTNILSLFNKKKKKIAIIMDEIDGMNNGDKGGINSLIRLIRAKKTKKQRKEEITMIPIICIGNYRIDKKIKELMKSCNCIELKTPDKKQIESILNLLMSNFDKSLKDNIINFIQGDLRKLESTYNIYKEHQNILQTQIIQNLFQSKRYGDDTKKITKKLLNNFYDIDKHNMLMNETDRTSTGLLFHENIIDVLSNVNSKDSINIYIELLNNFCFGDYIDRITFQKQIWIFNEMGSLIKTFYNNHLFHTKLKEINYTPNFQKDIRFTKVLTKYSTEYNNSIFIQNLCKQLYMNTKDLFSYFYDLRNTNTIEEIISLFENENYEINKLDINRIYRFIDRMIGETD